MGGEPSRAVDANGLTPRAARTRAQLLAWALTGPPSPLPPALLQTIDHAFSPDIQGATLVVIGNETVSGAAALDVFTAAADANPVVRAQAQQVSLGKTVRLHGAACCVGLLKAPAACLPALGGGGPREGPARAHPCPLARPLRPPQSIFHAFSPSVQGSALQVTGLDGQPTLTAVSDDAASFFVKDGVTHAGSVNVDASIAPADTLLPALTVRAARRGAAGEGGRRAAAPLRLGPLRAPHKPALARRAFP